jgi:hypothetical protein
VQDLGDLADRPHHLITLGYAAKSSTNPVAELWDMIVNYPGMLLALAGTLARSPRSAGGRCRSPRRHGHHQHPGDAVQPPHQYELDLRRRRVVGGTSSNTSSSSSGSSGTSGTFTGDEVSTEWGIVQVEITVENGKITWSQAVNL